MIRAVIDMAAAYQAQVLTIDRAMQGRVMHLSIRRRRLKVVQWVDIPTHRSIVHAFLSHGPSRRAAAPQPRGTRVGGGDASARYG